MTSINLTSSRRNRIFDVLSLIFGLFSLFMGFLIYARIDQNGSIINGFFATKVNFSSFNKNVDNFFNNLFSFGNKKEDSVSSKLSYIQISEHTFICDDQSVRMLQSGAIVFASKEENSYTVCVDYNDFKATYFNLLTISVKNLDHLKSDEVIGTYEENFQAYFYKEGKQISYQEIYSTN